MFRPVWSDPVPDQVRRITFVPVLRDGQCVLIEGPGGPGRAHGQAQLTACAPEQAAERLRACGQQALSATVTAAAASYRDLDDLSFYADNLRTLQRSYLRGSTAQERSGFGGDAEEWRQARQRISEGIGQSGTFLDVGCANGLLMESVAGWCAERDLRVEPYGIDIAPGLVELARRRLPQWADRIWVGNAVDWIPPGRRGFDYVHLLLDCVPQRRRAELIRHHLTRVVTPGTGRLLVSDYTASPSEAESAAGILRRLGFPGAGYSSGGQRRGRAAPLDRRIDARP